MSYRGFIYAIKSNESDDIYIGSTRKNLKNRLSCHKSAYKKYLKDNEKYNTVYKILKYSDAYIEEIELCFCESRKELVKIEGDYMIMFKSVNKNIGGQTVKEYNEKNKERIAQRQRDYIEKNRERIRERDKKYRELHKEKKAEYAKEYDKKRRIEKKEELKAYFKQNYEKNKERISEQGKQKYEQNKEEISKRNKQKVLCPHCEKEMSKGSLSRHIKKSCEKSNI